jgi:hypothetical protein
VSDTWNHALMHRWPLLAVFFLALVVVAAPGAAASASAPVITGDARGVALLERVVAAYRSVPGVETGVGPVTSKVALRAGVVVGEEATYAGKAYAARGTTTYVQVPARSCWRPSTDYLFNGIGTAFPLLASSVKAAAPHATADGWTVRVDSIDSLGIHAVHEFAVMPSYLVHTVTSFVGTHRITGRVTQLAARPAIATPNPRC